ncbi:S66 peptidase family protein [Vibrio sp. CAU 1672]|uniref:S66 family peptidase n=1 Tax=Vibrio sp. CAU 1672 TaxID=3032594 RepID=UPI0023DBB324|nr:S66 peptidase family protein [Vibrio sp. CAU 1672]MDF2153515.1 LD-carboxypeptidase [Vibrio sp. CAU 1672]
MLVPPPLKKGDTIGFFSPSSPATVFAPQRFERAKAYLQNQGYQVKAGSLTGKTDQYRSGSIQERVDELNALIRDPEVRCIMSTIGGFNSNALLPYLDYDALKKDPKIIVGYSDVTALLMGIYARTGIVTFYGPALVASLGEFPPLVDETFASFESVTSALAQLDHTYPMPAEWTDEWIEWSAQERAKTTLPNQWQFIGNGVISGRVIGGNLNTMTCIWASEYMPEIKDGDILMIEDCLQGIDSVERSFALLKLSGVLDKVSAIVLGKHEKFNHKGTGRAPIDVLLEVLNGQDINIVYDFDSCHTHPMLTVPLGATMTLDFEQKTVSVAL